MRNYGCLSKALDWAEIQSLVPECKRCPWFPRACLSLQRFWFQPIPSGDCQTSPGTRAPPHMSFFFFLGQYPVLRLAPETYQCCVWIYKSLWCTFSTPQKETGFTHFSRSKYEFVPSLHTKCWNEFVRHPHLSMTTTAVPISAQILSRRDNWGLFSFNLAVWSNSLGQSIMLLSKMPAKHYQRQEKRPSAQTKTLASSLLCTSDAHLNSN